MLRAALDAAVVATSPTYLLDFSVYKPPAELRVSTELARKNATSWSVRARDGGWEKWGVGRREEREGRGRSEESDGDWRGFFFCGEA